MWRNCGLQHYCLPGYCGEVCPHPVLPSIESPLPQIFILSQVFPVAPGSSSSLPSILLSDFSYTLCVPKGVIIVGAGAFTVSLRKMTGSQDEHSSPIVISPFICAYPKFTSVAYGEGIIQIEKPVDICHYLLFLVTLQPSPVTSLTNAITDTTSYVSSWNKGFDQIFRYISISGPLFQTCAFEILRNFQKRRIYVSSPRTVVQSNATRQW